MMNDSDILKITSPLELVSRDLMLNISEQEPEERERLTQMLILKAKEFGAEDEIKKALKAYATAARTLEQEYTIENAKKHSTLHFRYDIYGKPAKDIGNFLLVIENDEFFKSKNLRMNLLSNSPEKTVDGVTSPWTDTDDAIARQYIEEKYEFYHPAKMIDAFQVYFSRNAYHPIRDIVNAIKWDGKSRIEDFLIKWMKCEDTPYAREVSRLIFAGGIHRLFEPGCKFDDMPVLIGTKQGEGKSTIVRWLALEDRFYGECTEFEGARSFESLQNIWMCEVSELLALTKSSEQEAVKAFLTRQNDRYRAPYGRHTQDNPRQCIFIGTTNRERFLTDKTGNRRHYPIKVYSSGRELFDHEAECRAYIRQCWAEARELYNAGKIEPLAKAELLPEVQNRQQNAVEEDYRVGLIEDYLSTRNEVCILQLWQDALHMGEYTKPSKRDSMDISLILQNIPGWERVTNPKRFPGYGLQKYWVRGILDPENGDDDDLPI